MKLQGVITAMVTPFNRDNSVDYGALRAFIDSQIESGITALLPMGTTGESPTVSNEEHLNIIKTTVEQARGRVPVIAGTGSNCTAEAIKLTCEAAAIGANYTLQVAPYYNKPNQEGFYRHFMEVAEQCELPVLIYNIPGRSAKNIETETVLKLAQHKKIIGVKEASGSVSQAMDVISGKPKDFLVYSGDDNLVLPLIAVGADGVISVASNVIPKEMVNLVQIALNGETEKARKENYRLLPLFKSMFIDTNPIPVKTALAMMNKMEEHFRLPLCAMNTELKNQLKAVLSDLNLI